MRHESGSRTTEVRGNALWGSGRTGNDARASALWGKGGRSIVALLALSIALSLPVTGMAGSATMRGNGNNGGSSWQNNSSTDVPAGLLAQAQANPQQLFHVIAQGKGRGNSGQLGQNVANWAAHSEGQLQDQARRADASAKRWNDNAANLSGRASQSQQAANGAQADATAKTVRAKLTGKKADQTAASNAAQDAVAKSHDATQALRDYRAAQASVQQAQAAVDSAQSAFDQEAGTIVKQHVKDEFSSITGLAITLTGEQIVGLANGYGRDGLVAITPDAAVVSQAVKVPSVPVAPVTPDASMWAASTQLDSLWNTTDPWTGRVIGPAPKAPAIAIIDSGIDASKAADFGGRVVASVNFSSLDPSATGDQEGHGTMVAGLAAGASAAHPGAAPNAPLVDLRTADANGQSVTSDVIAATDWILKNKDKYNIKVANYSMAGSSTVSFRNDPLDRAVESLWFNGIVVVAASGNHGTGTGPVEMSHAPGNDPFVITVGAVDQQQTSDPSDDTLAWWSAYGTTMDGFSKPDLVAPGRYMVAPVPMGSTIATTVPDRIVSPGYIWMSGTSFSAPIVSGAAAQIIARHPDWTPDEVKGALMLTAAYLPNVDGPAAGVGEVDGGTAASLDFDPPNPNEGFNAFVNSDGKGGLSFNAAAWSSAVQADASWSSAAWSSAAWSSAAWNSAAWSSASWSSANFTADTSSQMESLATFTP